MPISILDGTKKALGIDKDYPAFDPDIVMHINSVFSTLHQLGVGSTNGAFRIDDSSSNWEEFVGDNTDINAVQTYMYLRVRLLFDPPSTSFAIDSFQKQIQELEWRLNVTIEEQKFPYPVREPVPTVMGDPFWWDLTGDLPFPPEARVGDMGYDRVTGKVWRKVPD